MNLGRKMIVYPNQNFAFQHVNRCGGTSITRTLVSIAGSPHELSAPPGMAHQPMKTRINNLIKHIRVDKMSIYVNVRNPFERLLSIYSYRRSRNKCVGMSFKDFFYRHYANYTRTPDGPISPMILVRRGIPINVKVVKLEDINKVWPTIIKNHFNKDVEIPKLNSVSRRAPLSCYTREMKEIVKKLDWWVIKCFYPKLMRI